MVRKARHPAEKTLSIISVCMTIVTLLLLMWDIVYNVGTEADQSALVESLSSFLGIEEEAAAFLLKAQAWIVLLVYLIIYFRYWLSLYIEQNRAIAEDLTCADLVSGTPKEIMDRYVEILGMKNPPQLFLSDHGEPVTVNDLEANGEKYIVLSSFLTMGEQMGPLTEFCYTLATKLAEIQLGHNSIFFQVVTLPGRSLPGFRSLFLRSMAYSSHRLAMEILDRDPTLSISREGIATMLLLRDYEAETRFLINTEQVLQHREETFEGLGRLGKALLRLGSDDLPLMDRIHTLMDPDGKPGPLL